MLRPALYTGVIFQAALSRRDALPHRTAKAAPARFWRACAGGLLRARRRFLSQRIVIVGGSRLSGTIPVSGSKNAGLAILAGALLASEGRTTLHNLPRVGDIATMADVIRHLGVAVTFTNDGRSATVDATRLTSCEAPSEIVARMRASFWVLGPLLARMGEARVAQPGGCNIGARPIDLHLKGLQALGAEADLTHGVVRLHASHGLTGTSVYLDFPSVGATMNIMMAAALGRGVTVIENAAQEPDVEDLGNFLVAMGARVAGHGTGMIQVEGVERLHACEYSVIPDRIEAGTLGLIAGVTGGDVVLQGANPAHLRPITLKMAEAGMHVEEVAEGLRFVGPEGRRPLPCRLTAMPHPGFPTDMQQAFTVLLCLADGTSVVTDRVYEGRFRYLTELARMGARTQVDGRTAIITGVPGLLGADVEATDLRAGAALVLAGLAAEGQTRITGTEHLLRGYECLIEKLQALGANAWHEGEAAGRLAVCSV